MAEDAVTATKLISECFIKPNHEVEQSNQPYYLAPMDLACLAIHYLQKGLLFIKPPTFDINSLLEKLQRALSLTLVHYYPLAGRFVTVNYENEHACSIYLDCNKGPGARFIHAICDSATVADIVSSGPDVIQIIRSFFELGAEVINYDGHTRALLSIQVTELIDGVFIRFTMNHSLGDGTSFWQFVNTLSEVFKSMDKNNHQWQGNMMISHVPIFKPPMFPDGYGPIIKLPCSDLNKFISPFRANIDPHLRERIFHLSSASIAKLKAQTNDECGNEACGQISSFQSICALLWRSLTRARSLGSEVITTVTLVADARTRLDPPLSSDHFGNMIVPVQERRRVDELLGHGVGWAAMLLHQGIKTLDDKACRDNNKFALEAILKPKSIIDPSSFTGGQSALVIGGSVRFNSYGPEFGLGKAIAMRTGYSAKTDGKVTANPGREGGGSVDLEVSLLPEAMGALERDQEFMSFVSQCNKETSPNKEVANSWLHLSVANIAIPPHFF